MSTFLSFDAKASISSDKNTIKSPVSAALGYTLEGVELKQSGEFTETLDANETKEILSTRRSSTLDATTELEVSQPIAAFPTTWRVGTTGVGQAPGFRTSRDLTTSSTTEVTITRISGTISRVEGTVLPFATTSVKIGDQLLIEKSTDTFVSPFAPSNTGLPLKVVGKGAAYVDVLDNGMMIPESGVVLGADFVQVLKIFSSSGVQVNDMLVNKSLAFNAANRGFFKVTFVSSDYVEVEAATLALETVDGVSQEDLYFADEVIRFLSVSSKGNIRVFIDGEPIEVALLGNRSFLCGTFNCTEIIIENLTDLGISVSGLHASTGYEDC